LTSLGVYILSYNRPQFLREAVRSVLNQQRKADRIVVLDNGSSADVRESIAQEIEQGVIWVGAEYNHSSFWNHSRVLESAKEDLYYLMHDDDRLLPEFLSEQLDFLEKNADVIASGCNGYLIDTEGRRKKGYARSKGRRGIEIYSDSASLAELYSRSYIPFPSIVYRNGFPQRVGFEEKYGQVGDAVFLVRLAGIGKIAFLDRELFEYRVHSGQDSKELREDLYRMKEALLVECSKDDPRYSRKVRRTVAENQTRRWMERTVSALLVHRSLKKASVQLFTTRPEQLDYAGMLRTILVPSRYLKRFIRGRSSF
jgi:glycosyltransferase involved in cell wall biosynthesis